ncbi:MAG: hypothetical protein QMD08_08195 [Actinomycetota bacterium]|nr:hypothetical protein [Actinomycetota bacterium]
MLIVCIALIGMNTILVYLFHLERRFLSEERSILLDRIQAKDFTEFKISRLAEKPPKVRKREREKLNDEWADEEEKIGSVI